MDFFNQALGQIRELMLSMTPAARVTAVLLLGVIGVSLGYLVQHQTSSPDTDLFNGETVSASVIGRADAAIAKAGLTGHEIVGNRIKVPQARKSEFLAAVADGGALPPNFHNVVEEALNLGAFVSGDTRREKLKAAREQQLSMLVSNMSGIEEANVMFDIREPKGLARKGSATATVSVRPMPGETLDARQIRMIKKAVAGGVADLQPDQVVVTNSADGSFFGSDGEISGDSFDNEYYKTKIAFEKKMQNKIADLLREVPGVRIQVTAELESTIERTTQTLAPEGDGVEVRRSKKDESDKVSEVDNGGRPGFDAQGPNRNNTDNPTVVVKNDRTVETLETENTVGQKQEIHREAALIPRNVRAAIAIPSNYLISVWRERERKKGNDPNQPISNATGAELEALENNLKEQITSIVAALLPKELAKNPLSDVRVTFFESLTPKPLEKPSTASSALSWASQNFNTMTMAFVALISLVMLRSMVKSIPSPEPLGTSASAGPSLAIDTVERLPTQSNDDEGTDAESRPRLKLKKGDSLKDDLAEIVKEDPEAAAAILRGWIGNAG